MKSNKDNGKSESKPKFTLLKKAVDLKEDGHKENKFEALSLCYANRSAALRRLCQYEDCLRDIARAARFGYPKENMFKLWERKAKCYFGLKRYELAAKCLRQSLNALKESGLSDLSKASKTTELQVYLNSLLKPTSLGFTHLFFPIFRDSLRNGGTRRNWPRWVTWKVSQRQLLLARKLPS